MVFACRPETSVIRAPASRSNTVLAPKERFWRPFFERPEKIILIKRRGNSMKQKLLEMIQVTSTGEWCHNLVPGLHSYRRGPACCIIYQLSLVLFTFFAFNDKLPKQTFVTHMFVIVHRGIHEKGSGYIVPADIHYLSIPLHTNVGTTSSKPFSRILP